MKEKEKKASARIEATIGKIKDVVDVNTIIGEPREIAPGVTVMTVSKVTYGFASGGSDFPSKSAKELFGGGGGAGVTISPVAFLVINKGEVSVKYICEGSESSAERIIGMVPDVVNKVGDIVNKFNGDKKENKDDSVFAEE